jgi:hypothetical protein
MSNEAYAAEIYAGFLNARHGPAFAGFMRQWLAASETVRPILLKDIQDALGPLMEGFMLWLAYHGQETVEG